MKTEQEEFDLLTDKNARLVMNRARAAKLRKRGEIIWWSNYFNGWIWMQTNNPPQNCEETP